MTHTDRCGDMVPSGLDFEAAAFGSVVCNCLSSCLLRGHQVTVNMGARLWLNGLVKCSVHGHSFVGLQYKQTCSLCICICTKDNCEALDSSVHSFCTGAVH